MSLPPSPPSESKELDTTEASAPVEPPESPAPSDSASTASDESSGSESGEDPGEEAEESDYDGNVVSKPANETQALVWYGGLLREITPLDLDTWDYEIDLAALTKRNSYTLEASYDDEPFLQQMRERVAAMPIEVVEADAEAGDMWMQIELAMRLVCGLTIKGDGRRADDIIKAICRQDNNKPENRHIRSAAERFDAWFDSFNFYSAEGSLDALFCAGKRCGRALWVETVPPKSKPSLIPRPICPIDLRVAEALYKHIEKGDFEGRKLNPGSDNIFEKLKLVWLDYTARRHVFLRYGPTAVMCAYGTCEARGTKEKPLFSCAGKCPEKWKPWYCSKECQERESRLHKKYCTENLAKIPEKTVIRNIYSIAQMNGSVVTLPTHVENSKIDVEVWTAIASNVVNVKFVDGDSDSDE